MEIIKLKPLSVCDTNSYIVATNEGNAVLIDAPADADYIYGEILKHGLTLKKYCLLTVISTMLALLQTLWRKRAVRCIYTKWIRQSSAKILTDC